MKHFLLAFLLPMTLTAQNMQQLREQLGKTVLYGDVCTFSRWSKSGMGAIHRRNNIETDVYLRNFRKRASKTR